MNPKNADIFHFGNDPILKIKRIIAGFYWKMIKGFGFFRIVPSLLSNSMVRSPLYDKISNMKLFLEIRSKFLIYVYQDFQEKFANKPYDAISKVSSFSPLPCQESLWRFFHGMQRNESSKEIHRSENLHW
jgi:hypothetical protein